MLFSGGLAVCLLAIGAVAFIPKCHAVPQTSADEESTPAPSPKPEAQSPEFSSAPVRLQSLPRNLFLD